MVPDSYGNTVIVKHLTNVMWMYSINEERERPTSGASGTKNLHAWDCLKLCDCRADKI
jgi:hypothetical protein